MSAILLFAVCVFLVKNASSASLYDQRQTGDLNVQIDLKDLRIIALMKSGKEEYVDYDYAYDYSEMTIKPQNGTTPKPLNGTTVLDTIKDNTTAALAVTEQTTLAIKNNNSQSFEGTEVTSSLPINDSSTTVKSFEMFTSTEVSESSSTQGVVLSTTLRPVGIASSTSASVCKKGFVMNQKGDCELKLQGAGNALLKLVKLSQKLKLRRENRRNEDATASA